MSRCVSAPRLHPTRAAPSRATTRTLPTLPRSFHDHRRCSPTPTPTRRSRDPRDLATTTPSTLVRAHDLTNTPTPLGGRLLLLGTTTGTAGGFFGAHAFLSGNYGADAATEWDGSLDLQPSRVELTDADVPVGDVRLPVLVAVSLRPRLGFALSPTGAAIEEQRLNLRRLLLRLRRLEDGRTPDDVVPALRRRDRVRTIEPTGGDATKRGPPSDSTTSSCFAEISQSVVVEPHVTVASTGFQCGFIESIRRTSCASTRSWLSRSSPSVLFRGAHENDN